jgi:hypothetical protein
MAIAALVLGVGRIWNLGQEALAVFSLTLIALKLAGVIAWSWWWVLSPLWISGIVVVAVVAGLLVLICRDMSGRAPDPRPEPPDGIRPPPAPTWQELGQVAFGQVGHGSLEVGPDQPPQPSRGSAGHG